MATAYAAVVSLTHVMDQIQFFHANQPVFLDEQLTQLQSLIELLTFFQDFLEGYSHGRSSEKMERLESRIANATHAAEDIIESHIVDDIHARYNGHKKRSPDHFSQSLQKVIESMDLIKKEAMERKENRASKYQLPGGDPALIPSSSTSPSKKDTVVVYKEDLDNILHKLTDHRSSREVIPITGMGGIGKTTLAKTAYEYLLVVSRFDIRGWVTISQQYDVKEILLSLLKSMLVYIGQSNQDSYELGSKLHKHLSGRRYLIVLDDMWSIEAWDELKLFFPENNIGSRIMVTSRNLNVAKNIAATNLYQMNLLDESKSWSLLCKKVFNEKHCPHALVDVGKKIAKNCKGLPLSIGAVGGLLAKSNMVREYWEHVAKNTNTSISSNDEENCLNILSLSYTHLPIHLKPCFLYLGVFQENYEIPVSRLIKLWVAEGILKPSRTKSLEQVGKDYLKDLIERNLLSVTKLGCTGNVKYFRIHDLLRDICLLEAQKEKFLHIEAVYMPNNPQGINRHFNIVGSVGDTQIFKLKNTDILEGPNSRRMAISLKTNEIYTPRDPFVNQPTSCIHSLICDFRLDFEVLVDFRLLRVFDVCDYRGSEVIFQLVNLRYLSFELGNNVLPSIHMLWNVQTIIVRESNITLPVEIWNMPQLKHVIADLLCLPGPPSFSKTDWECGVTAMENLQTLSRVLNFRWEEEIYWKIPNLVKLKLMYGDDCDEALPRRCFNYLYGLAKLQSLSCEFPHTEVNHVRDMFGFTQSLKKLTLQNVRFSWKDIATKIGSLPHLEKLKLKIFTSGVVWNPVKGDFLRLKYLGLFYNKDLLSWTAESVHFPVLEHLVVDHIGNLKEIPSGIGHITTLRLIELWFCSNSANDSAKEILKEQQPFKSDSICLLVNGKPAIIEDSRDEHLA